MKLKSLGNTKLKVSEMGLGCMGMSEFCGETDEAEAIATLHRALDLGINFFDTADVYGSGANEALLGKAFKKQWGKVILATKCGLNGNGSPDYVKAACDASLKRLGIDVIDLYYLHHVDKTVPIEETIGALSDLVTEGKVRYLGLSEVSAEALQKAHEIHPITALQAEYSLWMRQAENNLLPLCEKLHISFVAHGPLGLTKNHESVTKLETLAQQKHCTTAQLALAWILAKSPPVIPIPGTKQCHFLEENVCAAEVLLNAEDVTLLDQLFSPEAKKN